MTKPQLIAAIEATERELDATPGSAWFTQNELLSQRAYLREKLAQQRWSEVEE